MGYPGIHTIRGVMGVCHLLVDGERNAVLLDTGLVGEPWQFRSRLARLGLTPDAVKAILLTHGHLDHVGNLAWAKAWTARRSMRTRWSNGISTEPIPMRA